MATQFDDPDRHEPDSDLTIDLTDMESIRSQSLVSLQDPQRGVLKESGAKTVAVILVSSLVAILIIPLLASALLTGFVSLAAAQGYIGTVGMLLDAATRFVSVAIWPVFAYYFLKEYKDKR